MTKRKDYFVFTNTSERAVWRFDDNSWQGSSQLMFTKAPLVGGSAATNKFAQKPGDVLSNALLISRF